MSANPEKSEASQIELQHDASLMISLLAGTEAACANNSVNIKVSLIIPVYNTDNNGRLIYECNEVSHSK